MKKLLTLLSLTIFIFAACQENNSIVDPTSATFDNTGSSINFDTNNPDEYAEHGEIIIDDTVFTQTIYSKNLTVDGTKGGRVSVQYLYKAADDRIQRLSATLTIPDSAFDGELTFDMIFDLKNLGVELYPSPFTFNKPVVLDLTFFNVDLSEFDPDNLNFDYLDGEPTHLTFDKLIYNIDNKSLTVRGAKIPHFSRYGWTR